METYHQAAHAYQELLVDYSSYYGCASSDIVSARSQYASLLCKLDKLEEAEELNRENVTICQNNLGQVHRLTYNAFQGLAFVLAPDHPDSAYLSSQCEQSVIPAAMNASAERERRRQESLKLRQQVIEINTTLLGHDEEPTIRVREKFASFL